MSESSHTYNNTYYKTFTGTDSLAFMIFPGCKPILLGSLTTLSYSIYREKRPVPLVGKINVGGFTRGMRSIAGTMIFTLINQHFVNDLIDQIPYLKKHGKVKCDELPFFDIMVVSANEYGSASQMMIYGAEFIEEGQVLSIQDLFIENATSFVARDLDEFRMIHTLVESSGNNNDIVGTITATDFSRREIEKVINNTADLYKVLEVQEVFKKVGKINDVNGKLDTDTFNAISDFQKVNRLEVTGVLDDLTYKLITNRISTKDKIIEIINPYSTYVYSSLDRSKIIGLLSKGEVLTGKETSDSDLLEIEFNNVKGYVDKSNTNLVYIKQYTYTKKLDDDKIIDMYYKSFYPKDIGAIVNVDKDTEVIMSALAFYDNDECEMFSRKIDILANTDNDLNISYLSDSYIYNINKGDVPKYIEFFIYPKGCDIIKFKLNMNK